MDDVWFSFGGTVVGGGLGWDGLVVFAVCYCVGVLCVFSVFGFLYYCICWWFVLLVFLLCCCFVLFGVCG